MNEKDLQEFNDCLTPEALEAINQQPVFCIETIQASIDSGFVEIPDDLSLEQMRQFFMSI